MIVLLIAMMLTQPVRVDIHPQHELARISWYEPVARTIELVKATNETNYYQQCAIPDDVTRVTGSKYCVIIQHVVLTSPQEIRITDNHWHKGDKYFIIRYDFTSHNAPYGPY